MNFDLGPIGIWTMTLDAQPIGYVREAVAEIEELGYSALWCPDALNRDPMVNAALVLAATNKLVVGAGIANIYQRTAVAMSNGQHALDEAFPGRFILGLGVGHEFWVEGMLGQRYSRPYSTMAAYLDVLDQAPYMGAPAPTAPVRVLAALGPKMLELAAKRAAGAHPYFVPVEHTAMAAEHLGPGRMLCVEQAVVLETDRERARTIGKDHLATYLGLPNYTDNLRRFGFGDDDLQPPGSDRLVDALVATGHVDDVARRVGQQFEAGATHVCVQVLTGGTEPPRTEWRALAPALTALRPGR